jgi:predicted kinase
LGFDQSVLMGYDTAMTIHLIIGATGAGKSTFAQHLAEETNGMIFGSDDWLNTLFIPDGPPQDFWPWALERVDRCETQMWKIATSLLKKGIPVIMDINMMNRVVRERQLDRAKATGFSRQIHYLEVDRETRWNRVSRRNQEKGHTYSFPVPRAFFDFVEAVIELPTPEELVGANIVRSL